MSLSEVIPYEKNELYRELLNVIGLVPFAGTNSASRIQMMSSHIGQTLVVEGATVRRIQTGMEREFGKYTFSIKMPCKAKIIKIIERYPHTAGYNSIQHNPETLLIYEDSETREIGCLNLPEYHTYHPYFGFKYKPTDALKKIRIGSEIQEGEILLDSPSITNDGHYKFGVDLNVAFMSHPAVSEDGIVVSRDALPKFRFKTYETRVVEFGSKRFPLNLYGTPDNYKPHPEIGELIREDGLLMALRTYDESFSPSEQGVKSTMTVDPIFDKMVYAAGPGVREGAKVSGRVIDIKVMHDSDSALSLTPVGMEGQSMRYDHARRIYYQEICDIYNRLSRERGKLLELSREFHRLVIEAISVVQTYNHRDNGNGSDRVIKHYRGVPLDDWRLEFVIEYDITPTIGFKLTDLVGGKGVICHVAEPHEMPVDSDGNRADIIMDPIGTANRTNLGRLYEQYFNASARDLVKEIKTNLNYFQDPTVSILLPDMDARKDPVFEHVWSRLLGFYQITSPQTYKWFTSGAYTKPRSEHLKHVLDDGIYIYHPPETDHELIDCIKQLEANYKTVYGPVSYIGYSGERRVTKKPVRIGKMYIILLEKTGDDWSAVSSGRLQNYGVLAQVTNTDKFAQATRQQAVRAFGETEIRIVTACCSPLTAAEIIDRNNNIHSHRQVVDSILRAEKPSNIVCAVDRNHISLGNARPLQLVKHIAMCAGWKFQYTPYNPPPVPPEIMKVFKEKWAEKWNSVKNAVKNTWNKFTK